MEIIPSTYQENIFKFIQNEIGHGVVEALAGSGKTTTALEALKYIPKGKTVLFLAFNRHIAEELRTKVPSHVKVSTVHGMGKHMLLTNGYGKNHKDFKVYDIIKNLLGRMGYAWDTVRTLRPSINKIVGLLKNNMLELTTENINHIIHYYSIDVPNIVIPDDREEPPSRLEITNETYINLTKSVFTQSVNDTENTDFNDQVFMPAYYDLSGAKYDFVFCDEAQDFNKSQTEVVLRCLKKNGRIIAIGDSKQSLYGFAGADSKSLHNIQKRLDATVLPLSITYRCPTSHVEHAQQFVPHLEAAPNAIEGSIEEINFDDMYMKIQAGDLVLSRYNSTLIAPCLKLISKGIKATIKGMDYGENLKFLIDTLGALDIPHLKEELKLWQNEQIRRAEERDENIQPIMDKYECITTLLYSSKAKNVDQLKYYIDEIFSDGTPEISFSTVHRAKGLEADNVFIVMPSLMPCIHAKQGWEMEQEDNIQYVAFTRAKQTMYMVETYF